MSTTADIVETKQVSNKGKVPKGPRNVPQTQPPQPPPSVVQPNTEEDFKQWLDAVYSVDTFTDEELIGYYELLRYKGFDRNVVLRQLQAKAPDRSIATQLIILCALQGPVRASKTKLSNGLTPVQIGIPASGAQGTQAISCQRITAATADLAAYYLKKFGVAKRLNHPCPGWLQFPSAGSIKLPDDLRRVHMDFSARFSDIIGGVFNEQIYMTMAANSYLSPNLHLFDL